MGLRHRSQLLILALLAVVMTAYSCRSTTDLVLDDPVFLEDMVGAALNGERFAINPDDYPGIRELMADERSDYRLAGLIMALQTEDAAFYPFIVAAAADKNQDVAEAALDALKQSPELYEPYLRNLLETGNVQDRINALRFLAEIGNEDLVPLFIEYFSYPDPGVRNQASLSVRALTNRDNPFLREALDDSDPLTASIAYRTLGRFADPDDVPVFIDAFSSPFSEVRREAQLAALRSGEAGLPFLHIAASDPGRTYRSRLSSLDVIQGLRSPESLSMLLDLLDDRDERIRMKVDSILGTYGAEAVPALADLYDQSEEAYRIHAVRLMGDIRAPSAIPTLIRALDDQSETVRTLATKSLESFGDDAWPPLRASLSDGGNLARATSLRLLRRQGDPWLAVTGQGQPNTSALLLLITASDTTEIEDYLARTSVSRLRAETILSLKVAWDIAEEFVALDDAISEGTDPYLYAWRRKELYAVAGREALQRSFQELHNYFDNRDPEVLEKARILRAESRRLENEARKQRDLINAMSDQTKAAGESRLATYRGLRDQLVRTWQYAVPELRPLAEALYAQRDLDPAALSKESALLD